MDILQKGRTADLRPLGARFTTFDGADRWGATAAPWPSTSRLEADPFVCFGEGDPDDPPEPKKLSMTQEEFDRKVEARLAKERKKYADYDELKAKAKAHDELAAELESTKTKLEDALKDAEGDELKKELATLRAELGTTKGELEKTTKLASELQQGRDTAVQRYRTAEVSRRVRSALAEAGALTTGGSLDFAVDALMGRGNPEITEDDDGQIGVAFTIGDQRFEDLKRAAEVFLQQAPVFAKAPGGGSGGGPGNGGGPLPADLSELSSDQLAELAAKSDGGTR